MLRVYRSPASQAAPGMTNYLTFRDQDSVFPGTEKISYDNITDGADHTIMVVEANDSRAVVWTKPDDLEYDPKRPLDGLVGLWPGAFLAVLCDAELRKSLRASTPRSCAAWSTVTTASRSPSSDALGRRFPSFPTQRGV